MKLEPETLAHIKFLKPEAGGMDNLPSGHLSAPMSLKEGGAEWTLLMEFLSPVEYNRPVASIVSFLSDEAPSDQLIIGQKFEVLQGSDVIAEGEIIIDNIDIDEDGPIDSDIGPVRIKNSTNDNGDIDLDDYEDDMSLKEIMDRAEELGDFEFDPKEFML